MLLKSLMEEFNKSLQEIGEDYDPEEADTVRAATKNIHTLAHTKKNWKDAARNMHDISIWDKTRHKANKRAVTGMDEDGPKFTGYWKGKDKGTPGKKMVGSESVEEPTSNPTDKITMDIPLFIRMMEYSREDAKDDMDLHNVSERAIELMQQHDYLCMDNYDELVGGQGVDEGFGDPGSLTGFPKASWKDKSDKPRSISPEQQAKMKAAAKAKNDERNAAKKQHAGVTKTLTDLGVTKKQAEREAGYTMAEGKKKGVDGKACWDGYRYAGTKNGKDKCVPVKEGLSAKDSVERWITDFKKSTHPKFKGKSPAEREKMARAAHYKTVQNKK